jgi:hypothetical protein
MRDSIRFGLMGCLLLFLLGCRKPEAADEVEVEQRTSAVLPGLDGAVKVRVGDVQRGKTADVEIIGSDSITLATRKGAQVGDRVAFTHDGKKYQVEVVRFRDDIGPSDSARFRIIPPAKVSEPAAAVQTMEKRI